MHGNERWSRAGSRDLDGALHHDHVELFARAPFDREHRTVRRHGGAPRREREAVTAFSRREGRERRAANDAQAQAFGVERFDLELAPRPETHVDPRIDAETRATIAGAHAIA